MKRILTMCCVCLLMLTQFGNVAKAGDGPLVEVDNQTNHTFLVWRDSSSLTWTSVDYTVFLPLTNSESPNYPDDDWVDFIFINGKWYKVSALYEYRIIDETHTVTNPDGTITTVVIPQIQFQPNIFVNTVWMDCSPYINSQVYIDNNYKGPEDWSPVDELVNGNQQNMWITNYLNVPPLALPSTDTPDDPIDGPDPGDLPPM